MLWTRRGIIAAALGAAGLAGCGGSGSGPSGSVAGPRVPPTPPTSDSPGRSFMLTGAGATFPYPLYSKWFDTYHHAHSEVAINYQSIGSGGGIQQLKARTIDFGASDAPLSEEEAKSMPGPVLHIPTVGGAVALVYHLPGGPEKLTLTPDAIAGIYLGTIKKWDDPAIATANPGARLPSTAIAVVHRSDGSGTSHIFTTYLSAVSSGWKSAVGAGKSVNWPVGIGGKGNEGVTAQVRQTPGGIGYVELAYAVTNKLAYASVKNAAGEVVAPNVSSTTAAIQASAAALQKDIKSPIVNPSARDAYPIAGLTYLLVYQDQPADPKGKAIIDLLQWCLHDGQKMASQLQYAPLSDAVVKLDDEAIHTITYQGKRMLPPAAGTQP